MNQQIAGEPDEPSSQSAFVAATAFFLQSFVSFLCGRYTAGLSDYLGRKPILFIGALLSITGRVIFLQSTAAGGFYIAFVVWAPFSCFYFVILACISDLYPLSHKRTKRVGIFSGLVGGFSFIVGVPLGSALATRFSPSVPLRLSILMFLLSMIFIVFFPFSDTKAVESLREEDRILLPFIGQHRSLPSSWKHFLVTYFPIYFDTQELISSSLASTREAIPSFPLIWLVNFLMQCLTSLLYLIFIQYCLAVFDWSPTLTSGAVLFIGVCLGILAPTLLHFYHPIGLAFYLMVCFVIGSLFLSIAGTGLPRSQSLILGALGVVCTGLGSTFVPSLQGIIIPQYPPEVQGKINGLLSQQKDGSVLPAYIMSLGFSLSLQKNRGSGEVYWPGSAFGAVSETIAFVASL